MFTTFFEVIAFGLVAYGFWLAWHPLGWIVGGVLLALTAYLVDRGR